MQTATTYNFTFRCPSDASAPIPDGLPTSGTLADAEDVAADFGVTVVLTDAAGFAKGLVYADGGYFLT